MNSRDTAQKLKKIKTSDGEIKSTCKVKGIRLNFRNSEKINIDSIENLVLHSLDSEDEKNSVIDEDYNEGNYKIKLYFRAIKRTEGFYEVKTMM